MSAPSAASLPRHTLGWYALGSLPDGGGIILGAESLGRKAMLGIGTLIAGFTVDAVGLTIGAAPEAVALEVSNRLGLAQGAVMTTLMVIALLFIRSYDVSRARHAEVSSQLP